MLKIWFGRYKREYPRGINKSDYYFDEIFDKSYLLTDLARRFVYDILEGGEVISEDCIRHPLFGTIPASKLPTGIKTVMIAIYDDEIMTNLTYCGNNCIPYLLEGARDKDIVVSCSRSLSLYTDDNPTYGHEIYVMNNDTIISDFDGYINTWLEYRGKDIY